MGATKITTCCYCGTRAALVLRGKERHELTCSNCGAPIHAMKMLPKDAQPKRGKVTKHGYKETKKYHRDYDDDYARRPKKRRKSKSFGRKVMSGLWDVMEEIVDEVFD
ncbi:hypothetical protein SLH49_09990 [Cognatiyoonia sp. IB215446]|uniref:hypothetical protein n=1 Tax=Cognatiyoonia sp. IB215446 TaxID=3097355 RepID=UPI002A137FF9|nr:hypothetical protein [Cognatiyoonia sp. IB215446]MDX8348317.1 hypothetical protein [Cognatiyoonia sp. IB215446]